MWTDMKRERFGYLRAREAEGAITEPELHELEGLFSELDAAEAADLLDAGQRSETKQLELRDEQRRLAESAGQLELLRDEHLRLLADARSYLEKLRTRRASLADTFRRVTGHELSAKA